MLVGSEGELKARVVALVERTIEEGSEAFNVMTARGNEVRWPEVVATCRTMPMMASRRVVVLSSLQEARERDVEAFLAYLEEPSPTTCLVADVEGGDGRRQPFATLLKRGTVVECAPLSDLDAASYVVDLAKKQGVTMRRDAAALLVERVGSDMALLASEVERLVVYAHPEKDVDTWTVSRLVGASRQLSVFAYVGALARRDLPAAYGALRQLLNDGEAPLGILALIERQFRMMLAAAEAQKRGAAPQEACRVAGVPPFSTRRFLGELRAWPLPALERAYPIFLKKDQDMKSRGVSPEAELELLTTQLVTLV